MLRAVGSSGNPLAAGITIGTSVITGGTTQRVLYDNGGVVGETAGLLTNGTTVTVAGAATVTVNGAASTPGLKGNGTWFTSGTTTTTTPYFLIEPTGTTSTAWATAGTGVGINTPSGFVGRSIDIKTNNTSVLYYDVQNTKFVTGNGSDFDFVGGKFTTKGGQSVVSTVANVGKIYLDGPNAVLNLSSDAVFGFGSSTTAGGTNDSGVSRLAPGSLALGTGAQGSVAGSLSLTGITNAGDTTYSVAAKGPILKQGANGRVGTFVANGATPVVVANSSIAVTDAIIISLNTVGGTGPVIQPFVATCTAGSGFTAAANTGDISTYNYAIIKNAA